VTGYSQDLKGSRQGIIHGIPEKCRKKNKSSTFAKQKNIKI
jgi:hypothetical protein